MFGLLNVPRFQCQPTENEVAKENIIAAVPIFLLLLRFLQHLFGIHPGFVGFTRIESGLGEIVKQEGLVSFGSQGVGAFRIDRAQQRLPVSASPRGLLSDSQ